MLQINGLVACVMIVFGYLGIVNAGESLNEAFLQAAANRDYVIMKELLKNGANIDTPYGKGKYTALSNAAGSGDIALVKFLIKNGANVEGTSTFPNSPSWVFP